MVAQCELKDISDLPKNPATALLTGSDYDSDFISILAKSQKKREYAD